MCIYRCKAIMTIVARTTKIRDMAWKEAARGTKTSRLGTLVARSLDKATISTPASLAWSVREAMLMLLIVLFRVGTVAIAKNAWK